jgi:CheY-like chemotaxis protein
VVLADRGQIQQILLNLIINAADAMVERGGKVEVTTGRIELTAERATELEPPQPRARGEFCFVRVEDQGSGISSEIRKHIFDPFFSTKPQGRGLGLAAALGIARVRGGGFEVESEPGIGSRFSLYLPASSATVEPVVTSPRPFRTRATPRILVVDDRAEVRGMVLTVLDRCGYVGVGVEGGRAAMKLFAAAPQDYSLAIVDMSMPDMDGEATFRALRSVRSDLPVLLSSGFDAHETAARLAQLEGVDFLPKPYRLTELQERVEALVNESAGKGSSEPPTLEIVGEDQ